MLSPNGPFFKGSANLQVQGNFSKSVFYFFNSFQEKIDVSSSIDNTSEVSVEQYITYTKHLFNELNKLPRGTKLVTYFSEGFCVPNSFRLLETHFHGELKFYLKDLEPHEFNLLLNEQDINDHIDKHTFLP